MFQIQTYIKYFEDVFNITLEDVHRVVMFYVYSNMRPVRIRYFGFPNFSDLRVTENKKITDSRRNNDPLGLTYSYYIFRTIL